MNNDQTVSQMKNFLQQKGYVPPTPPPSSGDWHSLVKAPSTSTNSSTPQTVPNGGNILSRIGNAVTSSEQAVGNDLTAGARSKMELGNEESLRKSQENSEKVLQAHIASLQASGKDATHAQQALEAIKSNSIAPKSGDFQSAVPESGKSSLQGLGDVAGVGLDVLSGGTYGEAAKGAEAGKLLVKGGGAVENIAAKAGIATSEKAAVPAAEQGAKKALGQTLKDIGTKTAARSAVGGGTGYAYDVASNLQEGKTGGSALVPGMGTALGAVVPSAIGGAEAAMAVTKETAPRLINSLVKPSLANFSYGKDPGRTVSELGITGNSLEDFSKNISSKKGEIGKSIGEIYSNPENSSVRIDATKEISKIDSAIKDAAKGGKNNQNIVSQLQNIKDAILHEHTVDKDGNIVKSGGIPGEDSAGKPTVTYTPRDLSNLNPQEAFDLKQQVSGMTKFNGTPSDDKAVNSVLQDVYGGLKSSLNKEVGKNNPEITKLNQQYADLTSAELATEHRSDIEQRQNIISMPVKFGTVAGIVTAMGTGGVGIPAILAGAGAGVLEKALSSTAVKTRVAAWLGSESPSVINQVLTKNPGIKTALYRALPKLASKIK